MMRQIPAVVVALALTASAGVGFAQTAAQTPPPLRVGGGVRLPTKVKNAAPVYPPIAVAARKEGVVIVELLVGVDGSVQDAKVLRSVPLLDQAALDAVRQWAYEPTLVNGTPYPVYVTVTVSFDLRDSSGYLAAAVVVSTPAPTVDNPNATDVRIGVTSTVVQSATASPAPVRVGGVIRAPAKIVNVPPVYPPIAVAARKEGVVIVEMLVGTDGTVQDAKVLRSVPLLDEAALDCIRQWVYEPTLLNGEAVPIYITVTVPFTLDQR